MMDIDVGLLREVLEELKAAGVTRFKCGEFAVEFPAEAAVITPAAAPLAKERNAYERLLGGSLPTLRDSTRG